jgi:hypothetical protein
VRLDGSTVVELLLDELDRELDWCKLTAAESGNLKVSISDSASAFGSP